MKFPFSLYSLQPNFRIFFMAKKRGKLFYVNQKLPEQLNLFTNYYESLALEYMEKYGVVSTGYLADELQLSPRYAEKLIEKTIQKTRAAKCV